MAESTGRSSRMRALLPATVAVLVGTTCAVGATASWATSTAAATPTCTIFWTGAVDADWSTAGNWSLSNNGPGSGTTPSASDVVCMSTKPTSPAVTLAGAGEAGSLQWAAKNKVTPMLTVTGTLTVASATVTSTLANLDLVGELDTASTFAVPGSAAVGTTASNATSTLEGNGTLVTAGTGSLTGTFATQGPAQWHNTGTFTLNGTVDATLVNEPSGDITALQADLAGPFTNDGAVYADGSLGIQDGNVGGTVTIAAGTRLEAEESTFTGPIAGPGSVYFTGFDTIAGQSITAPITVANDLNVDGDPTLASLNLGGVLIGGTVTVTGSSSLTGCLVGTTLITQGATVVDDQLFDAQASEWENEGRATLGPDVQITGGCPSPQGFGGTGIVVNKVGASMTYADTTTGDDGDIATPFTNNGRLTVASGILEALSLTNDSGGALTGGNYQLTGGTLGVRGAISTLHAVLNIGAGGQLSVGSASALKSLSSVVRQFTFHTDYQTAVPLTNSGKIELAVDRQRDSPTLIAPAYTQSAGGDLQIAIRGPNALGDAFGHLSIAGSATIGGTLTIASAGYRPKVGTTYEIVTAASVMGRFTTITDPQVAGLTFSVTYTPTSVVLTVVK